MNNPIEVTPLERDLLNSGFISEGYKNAINLYGWTIIGVIFRQEYGASMPAVRLKKGVVTIAVDAGLSLEQLISFLSPDVVAMDWEGQVAYYYP